MKKLLPLLILTTIGVACQKNQQQANINIYNNFGIIKIKDPFAQAIGYEADSADVFFISLRDVGKYHGKICPGIASGFMMIKQVLDSLYPEQLPVRGQIRVACSRPSDLLDVAGFITGARSFYGRSEINKGDLIVDTSLNPHQFMSFAMIFQRKDNGKTYKVIFHKAQLIDPQYRDFVFSVDKLVLEGKADKETAEKFKKIIQAEVYRTLTEGVRPGVYEIFEIKDYKFPVSEH